MKFPRYTFPMPDFSFHSLTSHPPTPTPLQNVVLDWNIFSELFSCAVSVRSWISESLLSRWIKTKSRNLERRHRAEAVLKTTLIWLHSFSFHSDCLCLVTYKFNLHLNSYLTIYLIIYYIYTIFTKTLESIKNIAQFVPSTKMNL